MSRPYSESEKQQLLAELSSSNESITEFCRRKGLGSSTLWKWRKGSQTKPRSVSDDFIELGPVDHYELVLGKVVLKVPRTESALRVADLIRALSSC